MDRLVPLVYDELRVLARSQLRGGPGSQSLQTTGLVHEAYVRLLGPGKPAFNDRQHFFRAAAEAMRRILIDHARSRLRIKRGGGRVRVELRDVHAVTEQDPDLLLALDHAFRRLEEEDPRAADVVRLRYFAGLSIAETAEALGLSHRTVKRDWTLARAWLYEALR